MVPYKLQTSSLIKTLILSSVLISFLSGCSGKRVIPPYSPSTPNPAAPSTSASADHLGSVNENKLLPTIYDVYNKYRQTPYRYGGTTKKGMDCSAFTQIIFKEAFDMNLNRTASAQLSHGRYVERSLIESGDLIFFKINKKLSHVGIYTKDGNFIHVSSKRGVSEDSLNSGYWKNKFYKAKRLL